MVLAGVHDNIPIQLLRDSIAHSGLDQCMRMLFAHFLLCLAITCCSLDTFEEVKACASEEKVAVTVERARANSVRRQAQAFSRPAPGRSASAVASLQTVPSTTTPVVEAEEDALADVFASMTALHRRDERRKSKLAGIPERSSTAAPATAEPTLEVPETASVMNRRLNASVRRGELSEKRALQAARWVDKEVRRQQCQLVGILLMRLV